MVNYRHCKALAPVTIRIAGCRISLLYGFAAMGVDEVPWLQQKLFRRRHKVGSARHRKAANESVLLHQPASCGFLQTADDLCQGLGEHARCNSRQLSESSRATRNRSAGDMSRTSASFSSVNRSLRELGRRAERSRDEAGRILMPALYTYCFDRGRSRHKYKMGDHCTFCKSPSATAEFGWPPTIMSLSPICDVD